MLDKKDLISVIVPCYNESEALPFFYREIATVAKTIDAELEIICVDDGSSDDTLEKLRILSANDKRIHYISFSRNFGKEAAMYAGLCAAKGDYVAIMDADLQDPPSLLPEMYGTLKTEDYDSVATRRRTREGEPKLRSFCARAFYKLMNRISKTELVEGARDFRLMNRRMVDAIVSMSEYNRFTKGIFCWVGFRTKWLEYDNIERVAGKTKWSFWKLFKYSLECIYNFSTVPLDISSFTGFTLCFAAIIGIIVIIIRSLCGAPATSGWASTLCVILFVGGLQLFCIGILGKYLSRTYLETKRRPIYIVRETDEDSKEQ
ncbi:MAG: glycosyltransferase family 2 protein [Eubacteriales bacterium]